MDFLWSKDQEAFKKAAIVFAESKLNDEIIIRDRKNEFSYKGWKLCAEFGLQSMFISKKYGGMAFGLFDGIAVLEGVGYGCRDNGLIFTINAHIWGCEMPLYYFGSEEQKKKYLPYLCSGKLIGAHAITEPDSGSDVYSLMTTAVKERDYYILNGNKTFVTNAPIADVFIVYARTGNLKGFTGLSCFLIDKGLKGLSIGKTFEKMGIRTSPMSDIIFNNCKVPKKNVIGKENSGVVVFNSTIEWERIFMFANCIGIMEHQIMACIEYAKKRTMDNTPIGKHQSIANKIVDMKLRLETSRLMLYKAAWLKANKKSAAMESAMVKLYISEAYIQNSRDAIHIHGGYGYMTEYELERELRDALAGTLYSGTSEIQRNIIAGLLGL